MLTEKFRFNEFIVILNFYSANLEIKAIWLLNVKFSLTSGVRMLITKLWKRRETRFFSIFGGGISVCKVWKDF